MDYLLIVLGIILIPLIAQLYINSTYKKYLRIESESKLSGFEIARKILDKNNLNDIHIVEVKGNLTDHYDSSRNVIRLSKDIFDGTSLSSVSIAAHECGHAIQNKEGYIFMKIRSFLAPIVNVMNKVAYIILILGFILEYYGLIEIAIILMSSSVLFQLITLPVEINASKRAKQELLTMNLINKVESQATENVLTAAALTYVAGLLATILDLLRLILIFNNRD